jgi:thioredoxin-like negative regulator of GroEL
MAPTLQTVAEEYRDKIIVYKVDVDAQRELASSFGISGIPAILFCPKNNQPQMATGLLSKADFDKAVKEVLLK